VPIRARTHVRTRLFRQSSSTITTTTFLLTSRVVYLVPYFPSFREQSMEEHTKCFNFLYMITVAIRLTYRVLLFSLFSPSFLWCLELVAKSRYMARTTANQSKAKRGFCVSEEVEGAIQLFWVPYGR
jgi:hypothetical protein